jgi:uroporphyrin-III C-methyltransferase
VVLMGLAQRAELAKSLISRGWRTQTPAAVLLAASRPEAARWLGTLGQLAQGVELEGEAESPGTLVVGEVVSLAQTLSGGARGVEAAPDSKDAHVQR